MKASDLYVVGVYSNPRRFAARETLARSWINAQLQTGTSLTFVEHAFGERPFLFDKADPLTKHFNLVQLRGGPEHELWLKEPMVNRGFADVLSRYPDAKYLCWEDTDIQHTRPDWAIETIHMLQHHRVGQTWTHSIDKDPSGNCARNEWGDDVDRSFCAAWLAGDIEMPAADYGGGPLACLTQPRDMFQRHGEAWDGRSHFGYSWAIRAETLRAIGRLIDWLITGSGDYHMAICFAGLVHKLDERMTPGYLRRLREYAARCDLHVRQDIGCVDGMVLHGWHGRKKDRQYLSRFDILTNSDFDPDVDIAFDVQGLPSLCTDNRILRDGLRRYNTQRNEDSVDL